MIDEFNVGKLCTLIMSVVSSFRNVMMIMMMIIVYDMFTIAGNIKWSRLGFESVAVCDL
jgi:hypothetical protein